MKKILIAFTIFLAVFTVNVGADSRSCEATLNWSWNITANFRFNKNDSNSRHAYIYQAKLTSKTGGGSAIAFCLDMGAPATSKDTYVKSGKATVAMRKAYAYATQYGASSTNNLGKFRYALAQVVIWREIYRQAYGNQYMYDLGETLEPIYEAIYCNGKNCVMTQFIDPKDANQAGYTVTEIRNHNKDFQDKISEWQRFDRTYNGELYVYSSIEHPTNQRFVSKLNIPNTCPDDSEKYFCTDISKGQVDITNCVEQNKDKEDPIKYCTEQPEGCPNVIEPDPEEPEPVIPACNGGVLKVVSDPAICEYDNETNVGHYWEELDKSECGYADEDGEPVRPIGDGSVAYLYCKEEAYQYYPGGIANPVPVGTHIVWPTSTATLNTIWGNLYSLSYEGIKTCKIKFSPNTKSDENMEETFQAHINNINQTVRGIDYVWELENIRLTAVARGKIDSKGLATEDACAYIGDGAYGDQQLKSQRELEEARAELDKCTTVTNTVDQNYEKRNSCKRECADIPHNGDAEYTSCINDCDRNNPPNNVTTTTSTCTNNEKSQREALVNRKQNELNAINAKINVCKNYINAYNGATEFLNNIVYAGKTKWDPSDLYSFESNTSMSYNDPEFRTTHQLKLSGQSFGCEGCDATEYVKQHSDVLKTYTVSDMPLRGGLMDKYLEIVRLIDERPITITATATYSLPDDLYHYVEKRTNKPSMSIPTVDYIKIGYSNLPISSTASVKNPYDLNIIVDSLGQDGKFTELANQKPYVCNYSVTNAPTDECVCPEGTKHAGKDLYCKIYGSNSSSTTITCADAQILYCDSNETFDEVCEDDKFCPNDRTIKITSCLNNGKTYDYCVDTLCNINEDFHCPSGTYNDGMDIKPCVFSYMSSGYSKDEAVKICQDTVCPYGGINIIYRTISLRNPFPGKTAGSGVSNTTNKFSLDPHIGRYPGSNWNSVKLVETQILKNRGVEGNAVYQKDPLYTFILDTNTIKEIRKYNDSRENNDGYADFTLECKDGVACLSDFIRNPLYGLQTDKSVCSSSSHSDFYACSER